MLKVTNGRGCAAGHSPSDRQGQSLSHRQAAGTRTDARGKARRVVCANTRLKKACHQEVMWTCSESHSEAVITSPLIPIPFP